MKHLLIIITIILAVSITTKAQTEFCIPIKGDIEYCMSIVPKDSVWQIPFYIQLERVYHLTEGCYMYFDIKYSFHYLRPKDTKYKVFIVSISDINPVHKARVITHCGDVLLYYYKRPLPKP